MSVAQHAPAIPGSATDGVARVAPTVDLQWEVITPDMALRWLARNPANRRVKDSIVEFYAKQMAGGLWREDSPEPIIFDTEGNLINGQHRLHGVVKAQVPIRFLVARGVDRATRLSLDTGIARTGGDALQMEHPGMTGNRATIYAAAIRGLEEWERSPKRGPHESIANRTPNRTLVALLPKYSDGFERLYAAAEAIHDAPVRGGLGLWLIMLYRFSQINHEATLVFAEKVATGANLPRKSTLLALRDQLNRMPANQTKLRRQRVARIIVFAWNYWRRGIESPLTHVPLDSDFPTPVANEAEYRRLERQRRNERTPKPPGAQAV